MANLINDIDNLKAEIVTLTQKYSIFDMRLISLHVFTNEALIDVINHELFFPEMLKVIEFYKNVFTMSEKRRLYSHFQNICGFLELTDYKVLEKYII